MSFQDKEELRRLCLRYMANRSALAFNARSVHEGTKRDISATHPEVEEALLFLQSGGLLDAVPNSMGGTKYFKVNSTGILHHEAGI